MKALNSTILALLIFSFFGFAQNTKHTFENEKGKIEYEKLDGRFNGNYTSYFPNGTKRAEGKFENNYRIGVWTLWDENGKELLKKEFFSIYVTSTADAVSVKEITYKKNDDGIIDYYPLEQKNVAWSKRIWRTLDKKNNPELFKKDGMFSIFYMLGINGEITTYDPTDDEFGTELSVEKLSDINPDETEIVAYKIKEEFFYDTERQVFETRIIGIMPVAKSKKTGKTTDHFWVYLPQVRKYLGFQPVSSKAFTSNVTSLDDLLYFHCYSGQIIRESNMTNQYISEYLKDEEERKKESEKIELKITEAAYQLWVSQ